MNRYQQGVIIVLALIVATVAVLGSALAWGPHHCKLAFPMVIGCAMGSYEGLAGGMFAASAAIFAGWLAWSAVQLQVSAEERRAAADRVEIETVIQGDLDYMAEGLSAIWKILSDLDRAATPPETPARLEGVVYGIQQLTKDIPTYRTMVGALGWSRRRDYENWLEALERLGQFREVKDFDVQSALHRTMELSDYFRMLQPETGKYFEGLWQRSPKAWTLGYTIAVYAGVRERFDDENWGKPS